MCKNCSKRKNTGEFAIHLSYMENCLNRGPNRILKMKLDNEIFHRQYYKIHNKLCHYTNLPIKMAKIQKELHDPNCLSVDRINPNGDYTEDNVVLCLKEINKMKQDLEYDRFITLCNMVAKTHPREV